MRRREEVDVLTIGAGFVGLAAGAALAARAESRVINSIIFSATTGSTGVVEA